MGRYIFDCYTGTPSPRSIQEILKLSYCHGTFLIPPRRTHAGFLTPPKTGCMGFQCLWQKPNIFEYNKLNYHWKVIYSKPVPYQVYVKIEAVTIPIGHDVDQIVSSFFEVKGDSDYFHSGTD